MGCLYNRGMKKAGLAILLVLMVSAALLPGCGGTTPQGREEEIVDFTIHSILIPKEGDAPFLIDWRRKSNGVWDTDPMELGQRFWKWEGGALAEIGKDEYRELASQRIEGNDQRWTYSRHSITVLEQDEARKEAVVEVGSLYGPLAGSGIRYLLREENGEWTKVSEETVWYS
jgi:hypothetical protein